MKKVLVVLALVVVSVYFENAHAFELSSGKMRINHIEMNDVVSDQESVNNIVTIIEDEAYIFDYSETEGSFFVRVNGGADFYATLQDAQTEIAQTLGVTKNEACYARIYATAPGYLLPEDDDRTLYPLPFCEGPEHVDINSDGVVNGVDLAECLGQYGSDYEENVSCDFNVDRKVNAVDVSEMIPYIGSFVE